MKTITKHLKRTKTLCENNRKQKLTSTLYRVKFVSYLLLDKATIILYALYFNVLCVILFLFEKYPTICPACHSTNLKGGSKVSEDGIW